MESIQNYCTRYLPLVANHFLKDHLIIFQLAQFLVVRPHQKSLPNHSSAKQHFWQVQPSSASIRFLYNISIMGNSMQLLQQAWLPHTQYPKISLLFLDLQV
jgi:hypothetical protein